jgi:hypothetical protein
MNNEEIILLQSTGEFPLNPNDSIAPDTSEFQHFLTQELPLAARAPRDFAAVAIEKMETTRAPRDFAAEAIATVMPVQKYPSYFWPLAAAAAIALFSVITLRIAPKNDLPTSSPRITAAISQRLDSLESELTTTRSRLSRGRFTNSTPL